MLSQSLNKRLGYCIRVYQYDLRDFKISSGTVDKPVVLPTKAALAGASILGPGVGTGLGIKARGAVDKLKGLFQSDYAGKQAL